MGKFRSKTGCLTCRTRRVKCDERHPVCGQCSKKSRDCRYETVGVNIKQYKPHETNAGSSAAPPSEDDGEDCEATDEGEDNVQRGPPLQISQPDTALTDHESSESHGQSTTPSSRLTLIAGLSASGDLGLNEGLQGAASYFAHPQSPLTQTIALTRHQAELVYHFAEHLSRWLDCTDATRQFSLVIPVLVKHDAILLHAVLAFAAKHRKDVETAEQAYGHCLSLLIERLQSENVMHNDSLLCAIVILRFVEQLDVSLSGMDSQQHLSGCSAMLRASQGPTVDPSAPTLHQAAFWVYVRQCLYTATVNQQPPNVDITLQVVPRTQSFPVNHPSLALAQETSWANTMTWLCARVVHYCFDGASSSASYNPTARLALWNELSNAVQRWIDERPASFDPIWTGPAGDSHVFPEALFTADWHGMAFGFYHFSKILLLTYKPNPRFAARNVGARLRTEDHDILIHARAICGACSSSPANVSNLITLCHTIFIWGPLMSDPVERNAILELLANLEDSHSWPTVWITNALKDEWNM